MRCPAIPAEVHSVLDIGCGDGTIGSLLSERRPDLAIEGVEVIRGPLASSLPRVRWGPATPLS